LITLHTKDPTRNGNGILYGADRSEITGAWLLLVETDFGHKMRLTSREVNELFSIGMIGNYQEWLADRQALRQEPPE
jgi:hypothetical protein